MVPRSGRVLAVPALVAVALALLAGCTQSVSAPPVAVPSAVASGQPTASPQHPNIVFVLTDDLSWNLVRFMPHVRALEKAGMTFTNYTVTDSLCCPSRASIFTGRFPHNTHVFTNNWPRGGFARFHRRHEEAHTFATSMHSAGYVTALMGKYLNGYFPQRRLGGDRPYVPPGWSEWDVTGRGYYEYGYFLNQDHVLVPYRRAPNDYLTDVLARRADQFVQASAVAHAPFMLEVATFAPHLPYTPAPRDLNAFPGLRVPRGPAFDRLPRNAPPWLAWRPRLTPADLTELNRVYRLRAQSVLAIDRLIGDLETTLARTGAAGNTDIVFSSDNGYHLGEYRMYAGKMTPFDTDVRVPLVVAGPGIPAGRVSSAVVENVDLAPTFDELAGVAPGPHLDGRSLVPLLHGAHPGRWRTGALVEHRHVERYAAGPDREHLNAVNPPSYNTVRTRTYTYTEYADGSTELYDRATDPLELDNIADRVPAATLRTLHGWLMQLTSCSGASSCWRASLRPAARLPRN